MKQNLGHSRFRSRELQTRASTFPSLKVWAMCKRKIEKERSECDLETSKEIVGGVEILMGLGADVNLFPWQPGQMSCFN